MTSTDIRTGARTFTLDELVKLAWDGQIRVPHFQRDFRWTRADVIQLLDSIHRGYPIGSLLLWERPAPAQRLQLGALAIDAPEVDRALWVVDGQQRVTSLANVLHPAAQRDGRFALGYDLRLDRIVPRPAAEDPHVIPLPVIFDLTEVLTWFAERPEVADRQKAAFSLARDLRQFTVPAYQVVSDDVRVLQDVFDRMNNSGKRLSRAEVFSALNAGTEDEAEHLLTLRQIAIDINDQLSFGQIDDDTVLQCVLARRGPNTRREIRVEFDPQPRGVVDFAQETPEVAFQRGQEALMRAVDFVITAGVPHFTVLPYRYLLVVLTRFLALHPTLRPAEQRLLRRWFWRAAVAGPGIDKGSTTGVTRTMSSRITTSSVHDSVVGLLEVLGETEPPLPNPRRFKTSESASKIIICSWWSQQPRRPDTGEEYSRDDLTFAIGENSTATDAVRPVFARRYVPDDRRAWAANRVLMPVLDEVVPQVGGLLQRRPLPLPKPAWRAVLDSHGITAEAEQALLQGDIDRFLEARQNTVATWLRRFLQINCEWGFENTPVLSDLIIDDLTDDSNDAA